MLWVWVWVCCWNKTELKLSCPENDLRNKVAEEIVTKLYRTRTNWSFSSNQCNYTFRILMNAASLDASANFTLTTFWTSISTLKCSSIVALGVWISVFLLRSKGVVDITIVTYNWFCKTKLVVIVSFKFLIFVFLCFGLGCPLHFKYFKKSVDTRTPWLLRFHLKRLENIDCLGFSQPQ